MTRRAAYCCDVTCTLFDRWLITIDPDNWLIQVAPQLTRYSSLAALNGQAICIPTDLRPRQRYVETHATMARAAWAESPDGTRR